VTDVVMPFLFQHFGNPSSSYAIGQHAKDAVETARAHVATLINCAADEVCFTSCATESINLAIKGAALAARAANESCDHIITCVTEHPAVLEVCRYMRSIGFTVTELEVDEFGIVSESALVSAIIPGRTALISLSTQFCFFCFVSLFIDLIVFYFLSCSVCQQRDWHRARYHWFARRRSSRLSVHAVSH
jgi:cysteine desulfurase